jgi:hypothetical protein
VNIEEIKTNFAFVGESTYHNSIQIGSNEQMCDLYIESSKGNINPEQIAVYNQFIENYSTILNTVQRHLIDNLPQKFENQITEVRDVKLVPEIINVPFSQENYDLVLVFGIKLKWFLFLKKDYGFRVELKQGKIQSLVFKNDTTLPN